MAKQLSFKTTDDAATLFEKAFLQAQALNPELTKGNFFAEIVSGQIHEIKSENNNVNLSDYILQTDHNEILYSVIQEKFDRFGQILGLEISETNPLTELDIVNEIKATQHRAMAVPSQVEVPEAMAENEIRFPIPEPHLTLLKEVQKRLSEYFKKDITIKDILMDMFIRYEVQRNEEWFYPHLIKASEFKNITGYTINELKEWLKKK